MASNNAARIAEITAIIEAGAKTVVTEGVTVTYDFDSLRAERRRLEREDENKRGRRPPAATLNLGGF